MTRTVFIVAIALSLASCQRVGQLAGTFRELQHVQRQVSEQTGTQEVSVTLNNGRFLNIDIANSSLTQLPPGERRLKALGLARLASAAIASRTPVEAVTVSFSTRRTYLGFINVSKVTEGLRFEAGHLSPKPVEAASSERWVPPAEPHADLYFVAIGDVSAVMLEDMAAHFKEKYGIRTTILPGLLFDRVTVDPVRSQLVADELISAIRRRYPAIARDDRARVIGITAYDMYMQAKAREWRFTFSLRSHDDHFAVVSYARMDPAKLGEPPDADRLRSRLRKMVAKNIGVMYYGLPLSQDPRSVLYGNILGVEDLDRMTGHFQPSS